MPAASGNSSISGSTASRPSTSPLAHPVIARLRFIAAVVCVAVLVLALTAFAAHRQIQVLSTAANDNMEFNLFQADREFLTLRLALAEADARAADLDALRQGFDVFYDRVRTVAEADLYAGLRADPAFATALGRVEGFLAEAVGAINSPDAALREGLPALAAAAAEVADDMRWLSVGGLGRFAEMRDARRDRFLATLQWLLGISVALFAGLILSLAWLVGLLRLSERRAGEISAAGARMHTIVETSLDSILLTDLAGRVVDANRAARELFGFGSGIGEDVRDLLPCGGEEDRFGCLSLGRRPRPGERRFECLARAEGGRQVPVEVSLDLARGRREAGYVVFVRDISIRRAAEDALRSARDQARAGERSKAEFLAVMSHEMRTPLNGLLGSLQMVARDPLTERQARLVRAMETSGDSLRDLIDDVLVLSKHEAGALRAETGPVDPCALLPEIAASLEPLAARGGNRLHWRWLGPPTGPVILCERHLRQVLFNLVGNAVKFTRNGRVDIEAERLPDGGMEFRVADTGIGIASDDLERIFDDFESLDTSLSRPAGGTGLGLAICRRLARVMGGTIEAESVPGEGSLFRVCLPPADAADPARPAAPPAPLPTARQAILVVEDNPINRLVLAETLIDLGHTVETACDGYEGIALAARTRFDLILMDISMPGLDGIATARRIRSDGGASAATPVVAVTAHVMGDVRERMRVAGIRSWLPKPIPRDRLLAVLSSSAAPEPERSEPALLVDADRLRQLRATLPAEAFDRYWHGFAAEAEATLAAATAGEAADELHRLAGSAAIFGLDRLHASLCTLERQARTAGGAGEISLRCARATWETSRRELDRLLVEAAPLVSD